MATVILIYVNMTKSKNYKKYIGSQEDIEKSGESEIKSLFSAVYWFFVIALFSAIPNVMSNGTIYWICATVVYLVLELALDRYKKE